MQQTIVVVRAGKTTYEMAEKGLKRLQSIDSKIPGIVINAADLDKDFYSYYGYDGYYDNSGDSISISNSEGSAEASYVKK